MLSRELFWLVRLRWLAVVGQCVVVFVVGRMLTAPFVFESLLGIISVVAASNIIVGLFSKSPQRRIFGEILLLDISALTAMLYLSGGASNPFGFFYIIHVALGAILLGEVWGWSLAVLSSICYGFLFFFNVEIPALSHHHHGGDSFSLHLQGMWLGFTLLAGTLAFFFSRIIRELKKREDDLRKAEARAFRSERLASVTSLAANAAHELNTPLATIKLSAEAIVAGLKSNISSQLCLQDAELISAEVSRCSVILENLRKDAGEVEGQVAEEIPFEDLIEEVASKLRQNSKEAFILDQESCDLCIRAPRKPLVEALSALIKNALESGASPEVRLSAYRDQEKQRVIVRDNGIGISTEIINQVGEPFFTTKKENHGMGLGVFLARTFVEQLGGKLLLKSEKNHGTEALLEFPA